MTSPSNACGLVAAVVLCGGRASRLGGGDKPLLPLDGSTLLDTIVGRLKMQVSHVAISANGDPTRFAQFGRPVLADTIEGQVGPLAGVLAGLRWAAAAGHKRLLSTAGDTPFLPSDLVRRLAEDQPADAIVVASSGGRVHPVVALWPLTLADSLEATLRTGDGRVMAFIQRHRHVIVEFGFDEGVDPFFNVNTPHDLAKARAIAASKRP